MFTFVQLLTGLSLYHYLLFSIFPSHPPFIYLSFSPLPSLLSLTPLPILPLSLPKHNTHTHPHTQHAHTHSKKQVYVAPSVALPTTTTTEEEEEEGKEEEKQIPAETQEEQDAAAAAAVLSPPTLDTSTPFDDTDFIGLIDTIEKCFSSDIIEENLGALRGLNSTWGDDTAVKLENLMKKEPEVLRAWYTLTRESRSETLQDIREKELALNASVAGVR